MIGITTHPVYTNKNPIDQKTNHKKHSFKTTAMEQGKHSLKTIWKLS